MTATKYVIDENVSGVVALALRRTGVDVRTLGEVGRLGMDDPAQLDWAAERGRVIVTHDHDFVELGWSVRPNSGVAFSDEAKYQVGSLVRRVAELHRSMQADDWADRVTFL